MSWLIGHTGYSFIDIWSLIHLAFWIFIGSCLWATKVHRLVALLCCLGAAFSWEVFEFFAQRKWTDVWLNQESWWNSWLSDPLTCVVGVLGIYLALNKWGTKQS